MEEYKMKDYYYFLGLSPDASSDEIKKVYRKLSLKYHPDKNDNEDAYFQQRFREMQEAYEILINEESRKSYDRLYSENIRSTQYTLPPIIKNFNTNKIRVMKGEEVVITWQTHNADMVKILPFGLESPYGEKRIKITEFKDGKFHIVLQAMNTVMSKSVVKGITITEIFDNKIERFKNDAEELFKPQQTSKVIPMGMPKPMHIVVILLLLLAIFLLVYWGG